MLLRARYPEACKTFSIDELTRSFRVLFPAMPPRSITFLAQHYYHISNRGVNRGEIFFCEENYLYLLRLIRKNLPRYNISIVAYCLLPNHYHLLLMPITDNTLNRFMKSLFGSYVQGVNKQQNRLGPLFQGGTAIPW
jgi:REP element-mobilizing transposase RayT